MKLLSNFPPEELSTRAKSTIRELIAHGVIAYPVCQAEILLCKGCGKKTMKELEKVGIVTITGKSTAPKDAIERLMASWRKRYKPR